MLVGNFGANLPLVPGGVEPTNLAGRQQDWIGGTRRSNAVPAILETCREIMVAAFGIVMALEFLPSKGLPS